jgi:O-antigen/teichoic acid export membrane protein
MKNTENNKRITRNMMILYFRMFFIVGISLYTSRVILEVLGVVDFGIYSVVGGVVIMLSFFNTAMTSATQRFISFELGKNDSVQLERVFSMSVNTHITIALLIFILAETVGLWFLNAKLELPVERLEAANWIYQISIFSFMTTVIGVPYLALIIAHERMNIYAYVTAAESILKLIIALVLSWIAYDKLKMYAFLSFFLSVIMLIIYILYCKRHFPKTNFKFLWDKSLYASLMGYTGWNIFGNLSLMTMGQGINILLNLFVGPIANAAWAISFQLNNAVSLFSHNIRLAVNPQIVKSHASGDDEYMKSLVFQSAKYSFFLLLLIALPIILEADFILRIWLNEIPDFTVLFCQLILINALLQCFDASFGMIFQALGKIKENQLLSGGMYLLVLPVSYFLLVLEFQPHVIFYVQIVATMLTAFVIKLYLLRKLAGISYSEYSRKLAFPVLKVTLVALIVPVLSRIYMDEGALRFLTIVAVTLISIPISVYYLDLSNEMKIKVKSYIFSY